MKSRKLRAVLAALSAVAVLATAMTGFAATVTTTTEYYATEDYAHVISVVSGANGDVTYLATTSADKGVSSSGILYIDQKCTSGEDITFDYFVNKSVIDGTNTTLVLGTNGTETITQPENGIEIYSTTDVNAEGYTIAYSDYYGNGDESVIATIEPVVGKAIKNIKVGGEDKGVVASVNVPVLEDGSLAPVVVEVEEASVDLAPETIITEAMEDDKHTLTAIFKIVGRLSETTEFGIKYNDANYKAVFGVNTEEYVAVKLMNDVEFDGYETYVIK